MKHNIILNIDSYKSSHFLQYPENTQYISSYIESRGGLFDRVVFFGLQYFIKKYLLTPITIDDINEAEEVLTAHGEPFNREGWEYILNNYNGYLPLEIQAIPEGTLINNSNCLVQITNTDPNTYWLTSYIETAILRAVWYPTTVASISYQIKKLLKHYLELSSDNIDNLPFKLHDFGARGASSYETSVIGGMAHLVNFKGTDTVVALQSIRKYYNFYNMPGYSIPAAEHSTIISWGKNREEEAYKHILQTFKNKYQACSIVCDSYDFFYALDNYVGGSLKEQIINSKNTVVIRPDSGDPVDIVYNTIEKLMNIFGYNINTKGYKVLPNYIRVLQGDGINYNSIQNICVKLINHNISIENISFGMGAELQQKVNRDTFKFAMKSSAITIDGILHEIKKEPKTDISKTSKSGIFKVVKTDEKTYKTINISEDGENYLRTIYLNGKLLIDDDWETIINKVDQ